MADTETKRERERDRQTDRDRETERQRTICILINEGNKLSTCIKQFFVHLAFGAN